MRKLHYYHATNALGRTYAACGIPMEYKIGMPEEQWGKSFASGKKVTCRNCIKSWVFKFSIGQRAIPI